MEIEMGITYPDAWGALSRPSKRHELIEYMREMSNHKNLSQFDLDSIVHFFFDDTAIWDDCASEIGNILFDKAEADAIFALVRRLNEIIGPGEELDARAAVNDARWLPLTSEAGEVLAVLSEKGLAQLI